MASSSETRAHSSASEPIVQKNAAEVPQTDPAITAPEYDGTTETAQVAFGTGVEIAYDRTLPEAVISPSIESADSQRFTTESPKLYGLSRKTFWTLLVTVVLALICGNIGVGLGIGLRPSKSSSTALPPSSTHFSTNHTILNDTSLAAITTSEGNRHVFFQEQSGTIRQSIFTPSDGKWSAPTNYIVATDAKLYTPISAVWVPQNLSYERSETICVFYVVANDSVAFQAFVFRDPSWRSNSYPLLNISSNVVASESRALSAAYTFNGSLGIGDSYGEMFYLCYEGVGGNLTCEASHVNRYPTSLDRDPGWNPIKIGPEELPMSPLSNYSGPLNVVLSGSVVSPGAVVITYVEYFQDTCSFCGSLVDVNNIGYIFDSSTYGPPYTSLDVHGSDLTWDFFWIKNSTLENLEGQLSNELLYVPFRRLASATPNYQSDGSSYLYRQLDQTTISEEVFEPRIGYWTSGNFTILS